MVELQDREWDCNGGVFFMCVGECDVGQFGLIEFVLCFGFMFYGLWV